jgi:L-threonylcarbamoyladenylate synthase
MMTDVIPVERWRDALSLLMAGSIVAIPTDTVYGIAALPEDAGAIDAIYAAKDRPSDKALPMLVATAGDAARIARISPAIERLCLAFWPGALTVVAVAEAGFHSPAIAEDGTVAVRMPAHDLALNLLKASCGVLAVTSANRSGEPPATSAQQVLDQLGGRIDAVIDAGLSPGGVASTVVKVTGDELIVLRQGAVPESELLRVLSSQP